MIHASRASPRRTERLGQETGGTQQKTLLPKIPGAGAMAAAHVVRRACIARYWIAMMRTVVTRATRVGSFTGNKGA